MKTILRILTNKHELERLCLNGNHDYKQCKEIEYSLYHSKDEDMRQILVAENMEAIEAMETILRVKGIIPEQDISFLSSMSKFLTKLISYNIVISEAEKLRMTDYDEDNIEHQRLLSQLWTLLKGEDDKLEKRYSSRWTEIGFLGHNPAKDLRGMGILPLKNLLYLLENDSLIGRKVFNQSQHSSYGFSFALMAIHFTSSSFQLLRNGKLKGYIYNLDENEYSLETYQKFFVSLFSEFADYWHLRKPNNVMAFKDIHDFFMYDINRRLRKGNW